MQCWGWFYYVYQRDKPFSNGISKNKFFLYTCQIIPIIFWMTISTKNDFWTRDLSYQRTIKDFLSQHIFSAIYGKCLWNLFFQTDSWVLTQNSWLHWLSWVILYQARNIFYGMWLLSILVDISGREHPLHRDHWDRYWWCMEVLVLWISDLWTLNHCIIIRPVVKTVPSEMFYKSICFSLFLSVVNLIAWQWST